MKAHCHEFLMVMEEAIPFIRENHPKWERSSDQAIRDYCAWFWNRKLMATSFVGEEIYGICLIKLFDDLADFLEPFPFNPTGRFALVDLLIAVSPTAIADTFEILFGRWGPQEIMIWDRQERTQGGAPRMYTWSQYLRLTDRLTYGLVSQYRGKLKEEI
jgi:hypothetical protein